MMRSPSIWIAGVVLLCAAQVRADEPPSAAGQHMAGAALRTTTVGAAPGPLAPIPAPADFSLTLDGDIDLGGFVFKGGAPFLHNYGTNNTALGVDALQNLLGAPGGANTALGAGALKYNTDGNGNTGVGFYALFTTYQGSGNTAVGTNAALMNSSGSGNTAIGYFTGFAWQDGDNNIALGTGAMGDGYDTGVIRIGGANYQTRTFIEGIRDTNPAYAEVFDVDVCVTSDDQLGPCSVELSSARFKQDIEAVDEVTSELTRLHPVKFRYKHQVDRSPDPVIHYGLLAEEVAEVFPHMVSYDGEGRPYTVRYEMLTPLLLSELQRQQSALERRDEEMEVLRSQVADLTRRLDQLAGGRRD